ncbi:Formyltransferase/hydrolase complex Fhc subunit C [Gemmata obscuriglobus]|uniref:Formylmethanofuran dehydrogenase subunit C n=1 Tax=Gemmata obscuriglobus TaxID=114 RepID=A0A2Z3GWH3_9BACT|nr:formylmethanofuran dehydrogenase subunit C [Gemmata obscuriglobus]AWM38789.1 formylmethanofuran dehydrogenase subunit C [Gemmata obscuriglobus]QEG28233.1 Formyltransferase/hydrolase complex Fhc subunit C [Gemmata obscuriglobus]VTS06003.1 formylmethanofuran dehydrogenase subunit c : Putative GXGXG motif protein OS=uncultured marine microorganism HF4000_APKG8K5 GN=ALOHA_HF4000APKG8K5ctg1g3 PE=4 SV=1: GXGXG [Gemmata obscuriglobus UQM 2246]
MLKLTLRAPSSIPLEVEGITPERVAGLSPLEVAKLPVQHGNRAEPLGEFFEVIHDPKGTWADLHIAGDTSNVKFIGARMSAGNIYVENRVGMHAGAQMSGGSLTLDSGAAGWLGAEMRGGSIEVRGHAGDHVGAAYRGSRRGMTGGTIVVRGSAGDELGLLMRRGLIVAEGACGQFAGASMIAGTLALFGTVGERCGAGMKRGTILTATAPQLPPSFRFACEYRPSFLPLYLAHFARLGVNLPTGFGVGTLRCFRGDMLTGGKGEVLIGGGT